MADTGSTATTYSDTSVVISTCYGYRVSAINAIGTGAASTEATATAADPPDQVTELGATPVSAQIDLSWTAPGDGGSAITGYKIERRICSGSWSEVALVLVLESESMIGVV